MWEPIYGEQILEMLLGEKGLREIGGVEYVGVRGWSPPQYEAVGIKWSF